MISMSRPQVIENGSLDIATCKALTQLAYQHAARNHGLQTYHRRSHLIWTQETQRAKSLNLMTFTTQQLSEYSYT